MVENQNTAVLGNILEKNGYFSLEIALSCKRKGAKSYQDIENLSKEVANPYREIANFYRVSAIFYRVSAKFAPNIIEISFRQQLLQPI